MSPNSMNKHQKPFNILSSTFLCLLVLFITLDWLLSAIDPIQFVSDPKYLPTSQNPVISKISKFLSSNDDPEIWVIGSSLPMMAIATTDDAYFAALDSTDTNTVRKYTGAKYLSHALQKSTGKSFRVGNLTCVACMISDAKLLLDKALKAGKNPKSIVYGIGPRSFIDNVVAQGGRTPMEQVVTSHLNLSDIGKENLTWQEKRDTVISSFWKFYGAKSEYHTVLLSFACDKLNRSPTIYAAQQKAASEKHKSKQLSRIAKSEDKSKETTKILTEERLEADLAVYKLRYNPPNFGQFEQQEKALRDILALCKEKNISLLVVAMPITQQNKALIDQSILRRYSKEIPDLVTSSGAKYLKLDSDKSFTSRDFCDSVHTNASGGRKIQDKLVESLKRSKMLQL